MLYFADLKSEQRHTLYDFTKARPRIADKELGKSRQRSYVEIDHLQLFFPFCFCEEAKVTEAGIVDEVIHRNALLLERIVNFLRGSWH